MDLFVLREELDKSGVIISFNGPLCHGLIEEIGKALRNHLAAKNIAHESIIDVFAVFIELTQNVGNYFIRRGISGPEAASSIITIGKSSECYEVSSGNIVLNTDVEALCAHIDTVNAMDREELKSQYRKHMRRDVAPEALGAGLGLLDIAKRSSKKMTYAVMDIDADNKFFTLTAHI